MNPTRKEYESIFGLWIEFPINDASRSECLPKGDLQISSSQEGGINCRACSVRHTSPRASTEGRPKTRDILIMNLFLNISTKKPLIPLSG